MIPLSGCIQKALAHGGFEVDTASTGYYLDGVVIYSTPERVYNEIQRRCETMYLDYLMCAPLSHNSFTLFTEGIALSLVVEDIMHNGIQTVTLNR